MRRNISSTLAILSLVLLLGGCSGLSAITQRFLSQGPPPADYVAQEDGFRYLKSCLPHQAQYI